MKKALISVFTAGLVLFAGLSPVSAQEAEFRVIPVELFACTYNDGKESSDLDSVVDKWNAWADKNGIDDYAAWTLTPYYYGEGANSGFDFIWLGAAKDAVALGKAQDNWLTNNDGLRAEFAQVSTCTAHANMASVNFKAPPKGRTPADSVLTFSDCKYKGGATFAALGAAMAEWSQHLSNADSTAGIWHWYPVYGGGGEDYSFKWIESFKNLAELGADYESFGNGRGFETYGRLFGHLIECDSSRVYLAKNRRFVQLR